MWHENNVSWFDGRNAFMAKWNFHFHSAWLTIKIAKRLEIVPINKNFEMEKAIFSDFQQFSLRILADAEIFFLLPKPSCIKHFFFFRDGKISNASECLCNALSKKWSIAIAGWMQKNITGKIGNALLLNSRFFRYLMLVSSRMILTFFKIPIKNRCWIRK